MRVSFAFGLGVDRDNTSYTEVLGVSAANMARVRKGSWETLPGWEKIKTTALTGVCRGCFAWTDYTPRLNIAFGTHQKLQVYRGGALYDITPLRQPVTLTDPFTTVDTTDVVTVAHEAHGMETGDEVDFDGASAVGGVTPDGTYEVTVIDADSYEITVSGAASSSATGGGDVTVAVLLPLAPGRVNGTGGAGYGTGAWGIGTYGQPSLAENYPRTWSFGAVGEALYANPRGKTIFEWANDGAQRAVALANAPARVEFMLALDSGMLVALGCTNQDGDFDPLAIRWCDPSNRTLWTSATNSLAGQYVLAGGGRIIAARVLGKFIVVWTDSAVYLGQFAGFPDGWIFDLVERGRGLIGPLAASEVGGAAYWMSPGRQFYRYYPGGAVEPLVCSVQSELDDLPRSQQDKVVASSISDANEVMWFYPGASLENDRAIAIGLAEEGGPWMTHQLARTSFLDKGPSAHPVGVDPEGFFYYHEKGASANGAAYAWSIKSKLQYIAKGQKRLFVDRCYPDFHDQIGPIYLTFHVRDDPQGTPETWGPYTLTPGETFIDFMFEGRMIEVEVAGNSAPTSARIGNLTFEAQPAGEH